MCIAACKSVHVWVRMWQAPLGAHSHCLLMVADLVHPEGDICAAVVTFYLWLKWNLKHSGRALEHMQCNGFGAAPFEPTSRAPSRAMQPRDSPQDELKQWQFYLAY